MPATLRVKGLTNLSTTNRRGLRTVITTALLILAPSSFLMGQSPSGTSWAKAKTAGKGTIIIHWYESKPFIYEERRKKMAGIEPDIVEGFRKFVKDKYKVSLQVQWIEGSSFADTYETIRNNNLPGTLAISAFSITPERQAQVGFSPSYMSDISVLIASKKIPVVTNTEEFNRVFSKQTAIAIRGTTYEQDLLKLKEDGNLQFDITYIPSNQNILYTIEKMDNGFGFIDLPVYMKIFNDDPSVNVNRQNLYPVKRQGHAFIFPMGSDWSEPLAEYFNEEKFKPSLEAIIGKYIDIELFRFVESLAIQSNDPVILLTKEKEIQHRDLLGKSEQIAQETKRKNFLIALSVVSLASLIWIIYLYKKRNEQKQQIEAQNKSIALKSEQLEQRNQHLVALDEEKNNLIKILAHDLRTPINHVQGLAQVFMLSNPTMPDDQKAIIKSITDAAIRLNKMITNILDVDTVENNRVKIFMEDVLIQPLVQQVVQSFEKQATKKDIPLNFSASNEKSTIRGDALFLIQIFENLVSNAIKFSDPGKPVDVNIEDVNGMVRIKINDGGPGFTDDDLQKVFKKFQRLSAQPTGGESSLGLGLSIVKRYVELMGGRVWCETRSPRGALFTVEFAKV